MAFITYVTFVAEVPLVPYAKLIISKLLLSTLETLGLVTDIWFKLYFVKNGVLSVY